MCNISGMALFIVILITAVIFGGLFVIGYNGRTPPCPPPPTKRLPPPPKPPARGKEKNTHIFYIY